MGWRTVVITQHAKISYSGRKIIVQMNAETHQIPIDDIQILLVETTQAVLTVPAITELSSSGAKIIFSGRDGNPACEVVEQYPGNRSSVSIQNQCAWLSELKDGAWTEVVSAKIAMQIQVVQLLNKESSELELESQKIEFGDQSNREAVVARRYFKLVFGKEFSRNDSSAINAALNYGYSVLLSAVNREIVCNGSLTQLGIHHYNTMNDFNLGSDLMEPFRPVIDYWVAHQKMISLTPDIKFGLIELLNLELSYNDQTMILRNALTRHVQNCLNFMNGSKDNLIVKVEMIHEVPNNAIISNV
ncbi:type II CRISPR-associated endonuclease Cas1 [Dellaglioa sp. L3N]